MTAPRSHLLHALCAAACMALCACGGGDPDADVDCREPSQFTPPPHPQHPSRQPVDCKLNPCQCI